MTRCVVSLHMLYHVEEQNHIQNICMRMLYICCGNEFNNNIIILILFTAKQLHNCSCDMRLIKMKEYL